MQMLSMLAVFSLREVSPYLLTLIPTPYHLTLFKGW